MAEETVQQLQSTTATITAMLTLRKVSHEKSAVLAQSKAR